MAPFPIWASRSAMRLVSALLSSFLILFFLPTASIVRQVIYEEPFQRHVILLWACPCSDSVQVWERFIPAIFLLSLHFYFCTFTCLRITSSLLTFSLPSVWLPGFSVMWLACSVWRPEPSQLCGIFRAVSGFQLLHCGPGFCPGNILSSFGVCRNIYFAFGLSVSNIQIWTYTYLIMLLKRKPLFRATWFFSSNKVYEMVKFFITTRLVWIEIVSFEKAMY